ncbi:iron dicitrate transport regulator FecR [Chitinophaga parva]|uniref:Iron dicitrate transport regulator FecR n=1 Tax=Chitinophaga parva TaxID=2169414 RepID=A0A2T7BN62_9BACT|nr:FecR domain-containing protein [Chitinophaga parva]PUZ29106.1 iron dicitrate transport regulator FecR [Chitinophaga parva]
MTTATLKELLDKFKQDRISAEELELLQAAVATGAYRELVEADILEALRQAPVPSEWDRTEAEAVLQHILQTPPRRLRKGWYWAAAALTGACLLAGDWWLQGHKTPTTAQVVPAKPHAITPGTNRAMLTLADGSRIPLDSLHSGALGQQGNAIISNNGQGLTYHTTGSTEAVLYNTVATPRGGQYQLTLADGSKVWLNAASSIRFPTAFNGNERLVEISGEAYFQVAPKASQPFRVNIAGRPDLQVHVLGTSFNVMAYTDEKAITTTLESGAVQVQHNARTQVLQPGYNASVSSNADQITVAKADLDQALAWKDGKFRFRDTNIQTIMRQVARWYDVEVQYQGDVSNLAFSGLISRRQNAPELLRILEATHSVRFEIANNTITVIPVNAL